MVESQLAGADLGEGRRRRRAEPDLRHDPGADRRDGVGNLLCDHRLSRLSGAGGGDGVAPVEGMVSRGDSLKESASSAHLSLLSIAHTVRVWQGLDLLSLAARS
jgi:hypothetical protein